MPERKLVYDAGLFRVKQQEVCERDGARRLYHIVEHPGAAVVLPVLADGRIVMIRNHRIVVDADLLELPAGTIDTPEEPIACARRELTEETGYVAERMTPLVSFYSSPGICTERMYAFEATGLTLGETQLDGGEQIRVVLMEREGALQAVRDGRIIDGKTIVTLLYQDRFARREGTRG